MMVINGSVSLPSWYRTEKETGITIQKLTDARELVFYLENPDPFIRRLAIIRAGQLMRKDSYNLLHGILDDNLETEENRLLAAYYMQKLNDELNLGFFINHPYLLRVSQEGSTKSLLQLKVTDTLPDIRMNYKNALIESQLNFDNEFLKSNIDEKYDVLPFSMKDWLSHASAGLLLDLKKGSKRVIGAMITGLFVKGPKNIISYFISISKRAKERKELSLEAVSANSPRMHRTKSVTFKRRRSDTYRPPLSSRIKSFVRGIINLFFLPFRVLYRYKWAILITLTVLYGLFSFTGPGRSFLFRINPQAYYLNTGFLARAGDFINRQLQSNQTIAVFLGKNSTPVPQKVAESEKPKRMLVVTASKGLYLRSEPKSSGNKLVLMKPDTAVEFLGEEKKDGNGGLWFKVRLEQTTGWANAQYLKEG